MLYSTVMVIVIISVQNATPVSLKFFTFQSLKILVSLLYVFSAITVLTSIHSEAGLNLSNMVI